MLMKMFYFGVLLPTAVTIFLFIGFLVCWFKFNLREKVTQKFWKKHLKKCHCSADTESTVSYRAAAAAARDNGPNRRQDGSDYQDPKQNNIKNLQLSLFNNYSYDVDESSASTSANPAKTRGRNNTTFQNEGFNQEAKEDGAKDTDSTASDNPLILDDLSHYENVQVRHSKLLELVEAEMEDISLDACDLDLDCNEGEDENEADNNLVDNSVNDNVVVNMDTNGNGDYGFFIHPSDMKKEDFQMVVVPDNSAMAISNGETMLVKVKDSAAVSVDVETTQSTVDAKPMKLTLGEKSKGETDKKFHVENLENEKLQQYREHLHKLSQNKAMTQIIHGQGVHLVPVT